MPITLLDGILVGFTLVSAMLAMVRGFSREVLSIASWAAAAAAAFFFYKPVAALRSALYRQREDRHGGSRRHRLHRRADRRDRHHHEDRRLHHRQPHRRARPHARLPLRRRARHPGRRRRPAVLQLAGRRQVAGLGCRGQVAAAARKHRHDSSKACCRRIPRTSILKRLNKQRAGEPDCRHGGAGSRTAAPTASADAPGGRRAPTSN